MTLPQDIASMLPPAEFICTSSRNNFVPNIVFLANLNKQAQGRYRLIVWQIAEAESVTENMKRRSQWAWVKAIIVKTVEKRYGNE